MPAVPFTKATACGNDFLIIDAAHAPADLAAFTRRICDRHNGVGADGVEWLIAANGADVRARLFNSDGTEAEISGNGTRCVAAYVVAQHAQEHDSPALSHSIAVRTGAGVRRCTLVSRDEWRYDFETNMGEPQPGDAFPIKLAFGEITGIPISIGNPQFVVFVDEFTPGWQAEGAEISSHHDFEHGTNVDFVRVADRHTIDVRFFERGAGETQSSGTGSCASAVAAILSGPCESPVAVRAPGGTQTVRWEREVYLRGPAQLLCRGEFFF
jgi:diaminopimelate epimerase